MKKLVVGSIMLASMFAVSAMAETWSGFVSDSNCGAKHTGATAKDTACSRACVKKGAKAVFVTDGKVYTFADASAEEATKLVGDKVTIDGTMDGDTITIASIKEADEK